MVKPWWHPEIWPGLILVPVWWTKTLNLMGFDHHSMRTKNQGRIFSWPQNTGCISRDGNRTGKRAQQDGLSRHGVSTRWWTGSCTFEGTTGQHVPETNIRGFWRPGTNCGVLTCNRCNKCWLDLISTYCQDLMNPFSSMKCTPETMLSVGQLHFFGTREGGHPLLSGLGQHLL